MPYDINNHDEEDEIFDDEEKLKEELKIWPDGFRSDHSLYYPEN
jgi:hypothetical protein